MFDIVGRSPFTFMTFGRCTVALGRLLDPRLRVFHLQSAIPYEAMGAG
jgi:hypothetical protein